MQSYGIFCIDLVWETRESLIQKWKEKKGLIRLNGIKYSEVIWLNEGI